MDPTVVSGCAEECLVTYKCTLVCIFSAIPPLQSHKDFSVYERDHFDSSKCCGQLVAGKLFHPERCIQMDKCV